MSPSDRNLRNLDRVDCREATEESVDELFNQSYDSAIPVHDTPDAVDVFTGTSPSASVNDTEHF